MDHEQKEFEAALLRSVEDMQAGRVARKTVFAVDGDAVRRVPPDAPAPGPDLPDPFS